MSERASSEPAPGPPRLADDRGETLVELLVTIVIMGLTVAAVVGGLLTAVHFSDVHRKQATAGVAARDYAEAVNAFVGAGGYIECAGASAYTPAAVGFSVPTGFSATVSAVAFWDPAGRAFRSTCSSSGLERVTVQVSSADGAATEPSVVVVRRP